MKQFLTYGLSGVANTLITYALYLFLIPHVDYRFAILLCYLLGVWIAYYLNRTRVFGVSGRVGRFIGLYCLLLGLNMLVTTTLVEVGHVGKAAAQAVAVGVVFIVGFVANKLFVFPARGSYWSSR